MNKYFNGHGGQDSQTKNNYNVFADSPVMSRLLRALESGKDIGDYGRLAFVLTARHFLEEEEIVRLLGTQPEIGKWEAQGVVDEVNDHDYSPPTRTQLLEWQQYQDFQICPPDEAGSCDVYQTLNFPEYITERFEEKEQEQFPLHA